MFIPGYYEIRHKSENTWVYFYTKKGESLEIYGNSIEDLKKKVKERNLPWNDNKVPDETHNDVLPVDANPDHDKYVRTDWWAKSNYKKYNNHNISHYWDD